MPKPDDTTTRVVMGEKSFTIIQDDVSLKATFVAPANVKLSLAQGKENIHLKYGKYDNVDLNAIHATGGDLFYVVMTLQRGEAPEVQVEGTGLKAKVIVGKQNIRFDGEKIVLNK